MRRTKDVMQEFKAFILKGNIIDMAVGVMIGGAFSKVVTSLVNDIFMPLLGAVTGDSNFDTFKIVLSPEITDAADKITKPEAAIHYGLFIQNILDFMIIGACMFFMIKAAAMVSNRFYHKEERNGEPAPTGPTCEELLSEILRLLEKAEKTE